MNRFDENGYYKDEHKENECKRCGGKGCIANHPTKPDGTVCCYRCGGTGIEPEKVSTEAVVLQAIDMAVYAWNLDSPYGVGYMRCWEKIRKDVEEALKHDR